MQRPSAEHAAFDRMCEGLEEWENLPETGAHTMGQLGWLDPEGQEETPLDDQILAGLVSPV